MRIYMIEDLAEEHVQRIAEALDRDGFGGGIESIYFLPLPHDILTPEQTAHAPECGPHVMAVETGEDWIKMELLVRAKGKMRCSCVSYATPAQRGHMIDFLDHFIRTLDIPV